MVKINESTKQVLFSYARAVAAAVLAVAWAGETSPSALLKAGLVAVVPPLIRWLNPNDISFGRNA
jgi:hypothetical protein